MPIFIRIPMNFVIKAIKRTSVRIEESACVKYKLSQTNTSAVALRGVRGNEKRYKYGDLALQVGGVLRDSNQRVIALHYYRPVLSSDRASYMKKKGSYCQTKKIKIWSLAPKGARHQDELAN
jgi:hypothetical protein